MQQGLDKLIDQLWSAVEALPDPDQQSDTKRPSKQEAMIAMLQRSEGATVDAAEAICHRGEALADECGWRIPGRI
jgi:hypothetical protein